MRWLGRSGRGDRPTTAMVLAVCRSVLICSSGGFWKLIETLLALRAGLEPLVQPVVLLRHLARALLNVSQHAPRVGDRIVAGKLAPGRLDAHQVAFAAGQ